MTRQMVNAGCKFEHIYSSPAERAKLTIKWIAKTLPEQNLNWHLDDDLYTFDGKDLLMWCRKLPDNEAEVVVIGHNPALTDFCNAMAGDVIDNMPTSSYVQLSFDVSSWKDLANGTAKLETFLKPKMFKT